MGLPLPVGPGDGPQYHLSNPLDPAAKRRPKKLKVPPSRSIGFGMIHSLPRDRTVQEGGAATERQLQQEAAAAATGIGLAGGSAGQSKVKIPSARTMITNPPLQENAPMSAWSDSDDGEKNPELKPTKLPLASMKQKGKTTRDGQYSRHVCYPSQRWCKAKDTYPPEPPSDDDTPVPTPRVKRMAKKLPKDKASNWAAPEKPWSGAGAPGGGMSVQELMKHTKFTGKTKRRSLTPPPTTSAPGHAALPQRSQTPPPVFASQANSALVVVRG